MIEKKVSLKDLRELLEKRPRLPNPFDYEFDTEETLEWFREFVEAFNKFEKYHLKSLRKMMYSRPDFREGDSAKDIEVWLNLFENKLKEILGENEVEQK